MPEGLDEVLSNIHKLQVQNKRVAREAVSEVADKTADILKGNTPVDGGQMQSDVAVSGFKGGPQGQIEKDIGFGKSAGWRVKYPDTGTIYQRAQNFKEKTVSEARPIAKQIYADKITEGLKL
ncbi:phage protein, HK97 gp10 family [Enterococcus faecium 13.SD.W.09]|nr:phage protein, HK97 gp10 family [Enterococcus faecium 13.SD.W.09]